MLPHVDGWYRVEDTPPCKVAELGGLLGLGKAAQVCEDRGEDEGPGHGETHGYYNKKNLDRKVIVWEDMDRYPGNLTLEMRKLFELFGYNS
eukprot:scaffold184624_cov48-Prasinocladus_malaysianus.AAC.1